MLFLIWKKDMIELLKICQPQWGLGEDWPKVYEYHADRLSNNLRLSENSILSFFQFYCKIKINRLEIVVKATYDLHANKYFEIFNLTF